MRKSSGRVDIDTQFWPIVRIHYIGGISDLEFARHLDILMGFLQKDKAMAFVSLLDDGIAPPASQRLMMANMFKEHSASLHQYCVAWAQVTSSRVFRGVISAVAWLQPPPMPSKTLASEEEAHAWAQQLLERKARLTAHVNHQ